MITLTYSPEVQKQAAAALAQINAIEQAAFQRRADEEGCGAVICALLRPASTGEK